VKLRVVHRAVADSPGCEDLAVTPVALASLSAAGRPYLKPVDYFSPQDIGEIKSWVTTTVEVMEAEWRQRDILPLFLQSVGLDLCVLLESLTVTDRVLSTLWDTGRFSRIQVGPCQPSYPMLQYSLPYASYADLLADGEWCRSKAISVELLENIFVAERHPPHAPHWKDTLKAVAGLLRGSQRFAIGWVARVARMIGLQHVVTPELVVAPNRDNGEMLRCRGSVSLDTYLASFPHHEGSVEDLTTILVNALESWFREESVAIRRLGLFRDIIHRRLLGFIRTRQDLVTAYVRVRDGVMESPPTLLLGSAIGCSPDAWVSMAHREKGGVVASAQHGGGYGNWYSPYHIFSDYRFDFFFSYGSPELSPTYEFAQQHGKARWVATGSPILNQVRARRGKPPREVTRVLYVMNLSVSFYSANFPWEHVLSQIKTLELLTGYSTEYSIHVKEEHTGAVRREDYPGLHWVTESPSKVLHEYDLLILESGMSTAVLESASTNKFMVVFTGFEWEDVTEHSLNLLDRRAECFHRWEDFLPGLARILDDPSKHLDPAKLRSVEFMEAYCGPVSAEAYVSTIRHALSLS
jgi:hypothetical protein